MPRGKVEDCIVAYCYDGEPPKNPNIDGGDNSVVKRTRIKAEPKANHHEAVSKTKAIPNRLAAYGDTLETGIVLNDSDDDDISPPPRQRTQKQDYLPKPIPKTAPSSHDPPSTGGSHPSTGRQDIADVNNRPTPLAANELTTNDHKVPGPISARPGELQSSTNDHHPRDSKKRAPGSPSPNSREPNPKRVATHQSFQSNHKQKHAPPSLGAPSGRISSSDCHNTLAKKYPRPFARSVSVKSSDPGYKGLVQSRYKSSSPSDVLKRIKNRRKSGESDRMGVVEQRNAASLVPFLPTWEQRVSSVKDNEDVLMRQKKETDRRQALEKEILLAKSKTADLEILREKLVEFSRGELKLINVFRPLARLSVDQSSRLTQATSKLMISPDDPPIKLYEAIRTVQSVVKAILQEIDSDRSRAVEERDEENINLKMDKAQLTSRCDALQIRVDAQNKAALLRQKTDDLNARLTTEKSALLKNHAKAIRELELSLRKEMRDLAIQKDEEINSANAKKTKLEKTVTELQGDLRTMAAKLETQTKSLEDLKAEADNDRKELMAGKERLQARSTELSQELSLLKLALDVQDDEFQKLQKDHQDLKTENQDLIAKNLGHAQHEDELEQQKVEMETKISELETTFHEKLQIEKSTMIAEQATLQMQQDSQHKDAIQKKDRVISSLQEEKVTLEAKLAEQEDDLKRFRNESANNEARINSIAAICTKGAEFFRRPMQLPPIQEVQQGSMNYEQHLPSRLPPMQLESPASLSQLTPAQQKARNQMPPPPAPVQTNANSHASSDVPAQNRRKLP